MWACVHARACERACMSVLPSAVTPTPVTHITDLERRSRITNSDVSGPSPSLSMLPRETPDPDSARLVPRARRRRRGARERRRRSSDVVRSSSSLAEDDAPSPPPSSSAMPAIASSVDDVAGGASSSPGAEDSVSCASNGGSLELTLLSVTAAEGSRRPRRRSSRARPPRSRSAAAAGSAADPCATAKQALTQRLASRRAMMPRAPDMPQMNAAVFAFATRSFHASASAAMQGLGEGS